MTRAAVLGAGSWGTTFAKVLADAGCDVMLHARRPELAAAIAEKGENADYLVGEPVDISAARAQVREGAPLSAELLRETTDLIMSRVRDQLAELREETAPLTFHPRPRRELPGDLPGTAA